MGNGAVGTAAAVALSASYEVVLAGPPGTHQSETLHMVEGLGEAVIPRTAIDRIQEPSTVVAALKAFDIGAAVPFIADFCRGRLLCLSNGLGLEKEWGLLSNSVEYAVLTAGFLKTGEYSVAFTGGKVLCRRNGLAERLFRGSFICTESCEDMEEARWAKWYANSVINPLGALAGVANYRLRESQMGSLIQPLQAELEMIMPSETSILLGRRILNDLLDNSRNYCSMLQDLEAGRTTEIDYLTGYCLKIPGSRCPVASKIVGMVKARSRPPGTKPH